MGVLRIQNFGGIIPVTGDRALPDAFAVDSVNTWLYGQELRGLHLPLDITTVEPDTRSVFRIPMRTPGAGGLPGVVPPATYLPDSVWVRFTDHDTDVVKGQLVEDQYERYYFCSPSMGPVFSTYKKLKAGTSPLYYKLGVPGPDVSTTTMPNAWSPIIPLPAQTPTPVETRSYLYTWVNKYGEESRPCLPTTQSGSSSVTWTINNILDPPGGATDPRSDGYAAYTKKYLYRTLTGESGATTYYRVATVNIGTTSYADAITPEQLAPSLTLESSNWEPAPVNLQGFVAMPNGFLIGFDKPVLGPDGELTGGNNIYMSEAYHFHAWPPEYKYATETPIVGLGVIGQTCVVCTQGYPATVTGSKPASCAFTKATSGEPCLNRGSIVSTPNGVLYASQNGVNLVGPGGILNVTQSLITRDEWKRFYVPEYLRAVRYQNGYLALIMYPPGSVPLRAGFFLDPTTLKVALTKLSDFETMLNLNVDFWSGEVLLLLPGVKIQQWDPPAIGVADGNAEPVMPTRWKSKEFQYPFQENFGAYAIHWDDKRYWNSSYGAAIIPATEKVHLKVYADRRLVYDRQVPKNGRAVRLPSGFKAETWQFEITARAPVYDLHVASTMKELKQV